MKKLFALAALFLAAAVVPSNAGGTVKLGTLVCDVEPGYGILIGSSKDMTCELHDTKGHVTKYNGNISRFGVDLGFTQATKIMWGVVAPAWESGKALEGTYVGASAEATVGVGVGANVLVGGMKKSITLQPVSIQGQAGLDVAAGVAALTLKAHH